MSDAGGDDPTDGERDGDDPTLAPCAALDRRWGGADRPVAMPAGRAHRTGSLVAEAHP